VEFEQRRRFAIDDFNVWIVSREDLILSKLVWLQETGWQVQRRDIHNLVTNGVDFPYLRMWAERLGLGGLLQEIINARHGSGNRPAV
jgi:hypothetical protein